MSTTAPATKVADILPPTRDGAYYQDFAGADIHCVYSYNPPYYAVYRTLARVMVQYADAEVMNGTVAVEQRQAMRPLTGLRGQVNSLIDGWHNASQRNDMADWSFGSWAVFLLCFRWLPWRISAADETQKKAARYDRRMADAITTALEGDVPSAYALLQDVKNDIVSERTSIARVKYLVTAFLVAVASLLAILTVSGSLFHPPRNPVWVGVGGGTVGAFFSIAIGLRGRTILIDLQNRDNIADAVLRVVIGCMSGGILLCLLLSRLVEISGVQVISGNGAPTPGHDPAIVEFVLGFFAGFFERLVPNLLEKTNLGSQSAAGATAPPSGPSTRPDGPSKKDGQDGAPRRPIEPDRPASPDAAAKPGAAAGEDEEGPPEAPPANEAPIAPPAGGEQDAVSVDGETGGQLDADRPD